MRLERDGVYGPRVIISHYERRVRGGPVPEPYSVVTARTEYLLPAPVELNCVDRISISAKQQGTSLKFAEIPDPDDIIVPGGNDVKTVRRKRRRIEGTRRGENSGVVPT